MPRQHGVCSPSFQVHQQPAIAGPWLPAVCAEIIVRVLVDDVPAEPLGQLAAVRDLTLDTEASANLV
jgi:hypothetical protein